MSGQEEYWSQHLAAIEREGISIRAYAEREKVSAWSLYERRRVLKAAGRQPAPQAGSFVAVQVRACEAQTACKLRVGDELELELAALPDPSWLATLSAAMTRQVR